MHNEVKIKTVNKLLKKMGLLSQTPFDYISIKL